MSATTHRGWNITPATIGYDIQHPEYDRENEIDWRYGHADTVEAARDEIDRLLAEDAEWTEAAGILKTGLLRSEQAASGREGGRGMSEELKPCPFCGGEAKRFTIGKDEPNNAGGDVIVCTRCQASSHVEFGRKENLVSCWNRRTPANGEQVERGDDEIISEFRFLYEQYGLCPDEQLAPDALELKAKVLAAVATSTEDARERVKVLEEALEAVKRAALHGETGKVRQAVVAIARTALGNKEERL